MDPRLVPIEEKKLSFQFKGLLFENNKQSNLNKPRYHIETKYLRL